MSLSLEGKRHDASMLADSDLPTALERYAVSPTRQAMSIYGNPAYPLRVPYYRKLMLHKINANC